MELIGKKIGNIVVSILSRNCAQTFLEKVYLFILYSMGFGIGGDVLTSGELGVIHKILNRYSTKDRLIIFDVGANKGQYTSNLLKLGGQKSLKIYCFEPAKKSYQILKKTFLNKSNIYCINLALGEKDGFRILEYNKPFSGTASFYAYSEDAIYKERVRITSVDNFCKKHGINHIHFLKLDVEGNELNCIKGCIGMIKKNAIDYIQFEFSEYNTNSRVFLKDFFQLLEDEWRFYRVTKYSLVPVLHYKPQHEIFITTNYLLERK
jgi:FkbM family methyltransferase